ncbi:MAG: tetratricopeptide repeat protein [Phycisphaeraceae bacterium]|nr:tetratricopeptide repeat protein [Phycisphaeraceae bacterium]
MTRSLLISLILSLIVSPLAPAQTTDAPSAAEAGSPAVSSSESAPPADAPPPAIQWSATDATGNSISVPDPARATVVLFVMTNQQLSSDALAQLSTALSTQQPDAVQAMVVVSGRDAEAQAAPLLAKHNWTRPVVIDPEYAACETLSVRAWPTTVIIDKQGQIAGHLAGLPRSYQKDTEAYLAFALGQIDRSQLDEKLNNYSQVAGSGQQAVLGHLQAARRYIQQNDPKSAHSELQAALESQPDDPALLLTLARTQVMLDDPAAAIKTLDQIAPNAIAPFQVHVIRARALMQQEKWDEAKTILADSVRLNPEPAEAHYLLGEIEEHAANWQAAAEYYRAAFEATHDARLMGVTTP